MSSFLRDHGAAAATLALWPPVTMGVASLLYRRRQSAATASIATTATSPPLRPYKQPAGAKVIVVDSISQWEKVWTKIEMDLKEAPLIGLDCEWVSAGSPRANRSASSTADGSTSSSSTSSEAADIPPQPGRVALLQISTASGLCVLVRLFKLVVDLEGASIEEASASVSATPEDSSPLPESFRGLLKDKNISKLGVRVKEDATRLFKDHGIEVKGCVDLRAVVSKCTGKDLQASVDSERIGLKTLCEVVLRQTLVVEKQSSHRIRRSNWEAASLTQEQVQYAANEALVAIDIFREVALSKMRGSRCYCGFCSGTIKLTPNFWRTAASLCDGFADLDYQIVSSAGNSRSERGAGKVPSPKPILDRSLRPMKDPDADAVDEMLEASKDADAVGEPLDDDIGKSFVDLGVEEEVNYRLLTPDGEFFSECAASRALWYVDNGFGEITAPSSSSTTSVSSTTSSSSNTTSPSISLNFDPVGEPFEEKGVFYTKGKDIFCVVCGSEERFCLRKDIVPKMYRDHFPLTMESSQDILLMCSKCHHESVEMDNEFSVDLAKSCNAFPVGSMKDTNNVDPSQAGMVVEWMKAAYSGSLLQFERLWRQNFLEKMGPKHLPVTWSLERIQKPSELQGVKSVQSNQREQSKTNSVGAEHGAKSRSRKASMRDRGSTIVRFFSYLDPLVGGIPSFFLSRVLDHTNRLRVEYPQRSMHDQIADFAHHPVFKQIIEPGVKFEVKEAPITVSSFDSMGGLWTGGLWTAIRALTDRARERNEQDELSSEDRHQLESILGVWTGGISVITQQLFSMNLLTEKSVQNNSIFRTSEVPAVPKRLVKQGKDSCDMVSLSSNQTFNLDSLLSVWSFGLWSLTKSMISMRPKTEATLAYADEMSIGESSHSVSRIPQQLDCFLTMWSFGVWTFLRTLTGAEKGVNEDLCKATLVESSADQGFSDEKSQVHVSSSDELTKSLSLVKPNELFLSVWTLGLWHALRKYVFSASFSKTVGDSKEPAKIEKVSHATETDSKDEGSVHIPSSPKLIFLAKDLQSIFSLLDAWSFGLVTLISIVISQGSATVQDLHKLAVTEDKMLGLVKKGKKNTAPVEAFVEIPPERFHNIFISIWTFSLCNLLKLVSIPSPFRPNQEKFIAGSTPKTSTSHETKPSTAQTSISHENDPSNIIAEVQSPDAFVTVPVEKVSPLPAWISSNFSQGILEDFSQGAIKKLDPVNRLLSIWSFGIWELFLMIISRDVTSMSSVQSFPEDVEKRPEYQTRQFVENAEDTSSPVYISEPSDFFYIFWSLGLWPYYSLVQKRIASLLPISEGKTSKDFTLNPIGEKVESGKKTYPANAELDSKAEFDVAEESKLQKQHSDETNEVLLNESLTSGLDVEETVKTASKDESSLVLKHPADLAAIESTTAAVAAFTSTFQTPHWFHDVLSVWSFGAWTVLRILQRKSCFTMEHLFGEVQTHAQQIEAEIRLQKSSKPPFETSKLDSSISTSVDSFSAVELFYVVWSMGLWQINSTLYHHMQSMAQIGIMHKLTAWKKFSISGPSTPTLPLPGSNTQAISVNFESADKETLSTSETKVDAEREDQNIENASKTVSDEEPAAVLHEKSEPDLIKFQIKDNQSANVETMQETLDTKITYLDYLKTTEFSNEVMSMWSFGVWTILEVLLKRCQLTIEMLQVEAAKYGQEMEIKSEIKTKDSIDNAFNEEPISCDCQETYFFLLSFGLINYIETLKNLSGNLQLTAISNCIDVLVDKTKQVGSMISKAKVNNVEPIKSETFKVEPSDKEELTTNTVTDMQPEVMNANPNMKPKGSWNSDQTGEELMELSCLPSNKVEHSEVANKDSETQLPEESLISKAKITATDEDVDSTPQCTTLESIEGVSLADVWTFGMLSSTKKLLDMGGFVNPKSELLMGIWSFGLLPPRKPTEISSSETEIVLAQKSSKQSSQKEDAKTVEKSDEPEVTVRNDAMLQNLAANVWTFGSISVIQTVFEQMRENRKMFEFWFNIWLLGLWPTTEVEDVNELIENEAADASPSESNEKTPKLSPIQQNDSEVISAHDAVLAVMTLGIWVHFKALFQSIKEKSNIHTALEEDESKTKAPTESDQKTNIQLLENYPQIVLFSTLLNYWSFGMWSLVLVVLQKSTRTIKAIEDQLTREEELNVRSESADKLDETGNKDVFPKDQGKSLEISNNPTQYLLELWSCGLFGLLPVLKDQSDKFDQFKDLLFSLWSFGLWNLFQDVHKLESIDASATAKTVPKGDKTRRLSVHSLLSMWTLGLWINTKSVMARAFNSGASDIFNGQWLSWLSMLIRKQSLVPQKLEDVGSKEEYGAEQVVTPKLSQDTERENQSEHGSNSPNSSKSADYEMLQLEFDDLVKRFSSQLDLAIIHAVYEESHGNASTAFEILESMIESTMSSETFVHFDRVGNELSDSISLKTTHDDKQMKFPVLKVISPPTIKTVKANDIDQEEIESKDFGSDHVTSVAIADMEETNISLEGKDDTKIYAGDDEYDDVISKRSEESIQLEDKTNLDTSSEFEHITQTLSSDDMFGLKEDLVSTYKEIYTVQAGRKDGTDCMNTEEVSMISDELEIKVDDRTSLSVNDGTLQDRQQQSPDSETACNLNSELMQNIKDVMVLSTQSSESSSSHDYEKISLLEPLSPISYETIVFSDAEKTDTGSVNVPKHENIMDSGEQIHEDHDNLTYSETSVSTEIRHRTSMHSRLSDERTETFASLSLHGQGNNLPSDESKDFGSDHVTAVAIADMEETDSLDVNLEGKDDEKIYAGDEEYNDVILKRLEEGIQLEDKTNLDTSAEFEHITQTLSSDDMFGLKKDLVSTDKELYTVQAGTKDGTDCLNTKEASMIIDGLEMQVDDRTSLSVNDETLQDQQQLSPDSETAYNLNSKLMQNIKDVMVLSTQSSESSSSHDYEKISLLESLSPISHETIVFSDAEKADTGSVNVPKHDNIMDSGEQIHDDHENLTYSETSVSTEISHMTSVDSGLSDERIETFASLSLHGQGNNLPSDDASLDNMLSGDSLSKVICTSEKGELFHPESQDCSFVGWLESSTTIEKRIKSEANITSQDAIVSPAQSHITIGSDHLFVAAKATENVNEVVSFAVASPAKGVEVDEVLESDYKKFSNVKTAQENSDSNDEEDEEESDDDDSDESEEGSEDDDDNDEEISRILALAKKMESKPKTDDDWLSKLAKKISKPETTEVSETKGNEQNRDVFGDKDWDTCHDLEDSETEPVNPVPYIGSEYDMSSDIETAASDAGTTLEYDMSSDLETATSDSVSSAGEVRGHVGFNEYDLVSSSVVSLSDQSPSKESTPVQESEETEDKLEVMTSTPIIVRRMFTSSKQKLNESHAEVNVTLDHMSSLKKKLSESTTSIDSTDSTSTITKESVIPDLVVTGEEGKSASAFLSSENLSSRQEITHVTQSRVLYRSKSPSRSRFSESSDSSEEKETLSTSSLGVVAMEGAVGMTESESAECASATVLGSHLESTDLNEAIADQSDTESNADQEDVWVTETSEMVTSFVTETVRKMRVDEDGNEVVEEIVRVLGPDGREVSPEIVTLMRSPSFVRKN